MGWTYINPIITCHHSGWISSLSWKVRPGTVPHPGPSQFPLECPWSLQTSDKHRQCPGRWTRMFRKRAMTKSMEFIGNYRSGKIFLKKLPPLFLTICRNAYGNSKNTGGLRFWASEIRHERNNARKNDRTNGWLIDWMIDWLNEWTNERNIERINERKKETHECIKWIEMDH